MNEIRPDSVEAWLMAMRPRTLPVSIGPVLVGTSVAYVEGSRFRGGCFFFATSSEFGSRDGPVRDALARATRSWIDLLAREVRVARRQRELRSQVDPEQLVFELHAFVQEANWARELFGDERAFRRARTAHAARLERAVTAPSRARRSSPSRTPRKRKSEETRR